MSWKYETCIACKGKNKNCTLCEGLGFWEFDADANHAAVELLLHLGEGQAPEDVRAIFNRRLGSISPDTIQKTLDDLVAVAPVRTNDELQNVGAGKWGWPWFHTLRFAVEALKLLGIDHIKNRQGISLLAWKWLEEEAEECT